jgi:hypothetical protein
MVARGREDELRPAPLDAQDNISGN